MKTPKIVSVFMSILMLVSSFSIVDVSAATTLYGDYVLISNTSLDPKLAESTGNIEFDDLGIFPRKV